MKPKLFTLLLTIAAGVGTMLAQKVQIGDLYYLLYSTDHTATVTSQNASNPYWTATITNANIPESVTYNEVTYSVTSIGNGAFYNCTGLTSVTIPNSVTSIGNGAFNGCSGLTSITIPHSVTSIGIVAFAYCTGLTSLTIPNSVTSIERDAFLTDNNIIYFGSATGSPWGAKSVNGYVDGYLVYRDNTKTELLGCSSVATGEIIIPNSVTSICDKAFYNCEGLTSVAVPSGVTSIGDYIFKGCSGLTSVTIPNSVTSIGAYAFNGCSSLTSVTIPNSVTSIGEWAFSDCSGLTSVTIPNSVTSIGDNAFGYCIGLVSMIVENGNVNYDNRNDCNAIIETATNQLICGCKSTIIPNSVTSIGYGAFRGCSGLTSIEIPNSVTSIGNSAFYGCTGLTSLTIPISVTAIPRYLCYECYSLTSVTIPNSIVSIGNSAFRSCTALKSVIIPNSVTEIDLHAFDGCTNMEYVTIGNSVTSIGGYAFDTCTRLKSITCFSSTPPTLGNNVWYGVGRSSINLYVPAASVDLYKAKNQWKDFKIQPLPKYTITFQNEDGTPLQTGEVEAGSMPDYTGDPPTKPATAQYTYRRLSHYQLVHIQSSLA